MKNSAFAVDPCPRDLLGKQWLFMHMSAHYRRMLSAQSAVDSAPPLSASLKTRTATAGNAGTTPRSASRPVRLSQKPSRADTDPGPGFLRPGRGRDRQVRVEGRASVASSSHFDYSGRGRTGKALSKPASLAKQRRRDPEKPTTYYETLNQLVPDHGHGPHRTLRTSGQALSEVFTLRVPHKPQLLRTDVPSRLRSSTTYCPPRPRILRSKHGVTGREVSKDAEQPIWTASSPPVSSRDSAYNGGISSGGESRGPTPEQKGSRRHPKRSDRKTRKKAKEEHKRSRSADAKVKVQAQARLRLENDLRKRLVEEERSEMHEQRLRVDMVDMVDMVDPWREGEGEDRDDHGDMDSLHIDSHGDESPGASDQSVEEDLGGEEEEEDVDEDEDEEAAEVEAGEVESAEVDEPDGSLSISRAESCSKDESSVSEQSVRTVSQSNRQQAGTQTEVQSPTDNSSRKLSTSSNLSGSSPKSAQASSKTTSKQSSLDQLSCTSSSSKTKRPLLKELSSKIDGMLHSNLQDFNTQRNAIGLQRNSDLLRTDQKQTEMEQNFSDIKLDYSSEDRISGVPYKKLLNQITKDLIKRRIFTNRGIQAVYQEHIQANANKLDMDKMKEEVKNLHSQFDIPANRYSDSTGEAEDLENIKKPIISAPSDIWNPHVLQDQAMQIKHFIIPDQAVKFKHLFSLDSPLKSTKSGLVSARRFSAVLDSAREPMLITEDELKSQKVTRNVDLVPAVSSKENVCVEPEKYPQLALPHEKNEETLASSRSVMSPPLQFQDCYNYSLSNKDILEEDWQESKHGPDSIFENISDLMPSSISSKHITEVSPSLVNASRFDETLKSLAASIELPPQLSIHSPTSFNFSPLKQDSNIKAKVSQNSNIFLDAVSSHVPVSYSNCKERVCKCASSKHMNDFFISKWLDGEATMPSIQARLESLHNTVSQNQNIDKKDSNLKDCGSLRDDLKCDKRDCKCQEKTVAVPEILTIFRNTDIQKNSSDVSEKISRSTDDEKASPQPKEKIISSGLDGNVLQEVETLSVERSKTDIHLLDAGISASESVNFPETLSSIGTGVNSDIQAFLKSLQKDL